MARGTSRCTRSHQTPFPLAIGGVARETNLVQGYQTQVDYGVVSVSKIKLDMHDSWA